MHDCPHSRFNFRPPPAPTKQISDRMKGGGSSSNGDDDNAETGIHQTKKDPRPESSSSSLQEEEVALSKASLSPDVIRHI